MTTIHFKKQHEDDSRSIAYAVKRDGQYMSVGGRLSDESEVAFTYNQRVLCEQLIEELKQKPELKDAKFEIVELWVYAE